MHVYAYIHIDRYIYMPTSKCIYVCIHTFMHMYICISVLAARYDDDDDVYMYAFI